MSAQLITLVMIAYVGNGAGVTSQRLGDFYDLRACQSAAQKAELVGPGGRCPHPVRLRLSDAGLDKFPAAAALVSASDAAVAGWRYGTEDDL